MWRVLRLILFAKIYCTLVYSVLLKNSHRTLHRIINTQSTNTKLCSDHYSNIPIHSFHKQEKCNWLSGCIVDNRLWVKNRSFRLVSGLNCVTMSNFTSLSNSSSSCFWIRLWGRLALGGENVEIFLISFKQKQALPASVCEVQALGVQWSGKYCSGIVPY